MNKTLSSFSGAEKSIVPGSAGVLIAIPTLVQTLLSLVGIGEMPSPEELKEAITIVVIGLGSSYLVWQVPNSDVSENKENKK